VWLFFGEAQWGDTCLDKKIVDWGEAKACWMAKLLYTFKICLLEPAVKELPPDTIVSKQQISQQRCYDPFSAFVPGGFLVHLLLMLLIMI